MSTYMTPELYEKMAASVPDIVGKKIVVEWTGIDEGHIQLAFWIIDEHGVAIAEIGRVELEKTGDRVTLANIDRAFNIQFGPAPEDRK